MAGCRPKGYVGEPAHDGGTLLKSGALTLLDELDRERTQRWAQFHAVHAVQAALHGRRHGFRIARSGSRLSRLRIPRPPGRSPNARRSPLWQVFVHEQNLIPASDDSTDEQGCARPARANTARTGESLRRSCTPS